MMNSVRKSKSTKRRNDPTASEKQPCGGFAYEDDNFIELDSEAAEKAIFEGVRACEEELPFN